MRIEERQVDEITTVLTVTGEFNAVTLPGAQEKLDDLIKGMRIRVVVNLGQIDIVTSTAISFLMDAAKRTRKLGGDAVVSEPTKLLMSTVEALDFGDYLKTFETDDDAVAYYAAMPKGPPPTTDPEPEQRQPWFRLWPKRKR